MKKLTVLLLALPLILAACNANKTEDGSTDTGTELEIGVDGSEAATAEASTS